MARGYSWSTWDDLLTLTHNLAGGAGTSFTDSFNTAHQILTSSIGNAAYQYSTTASATTNYAPNGLNQYATVGGQGIAYDANGNLTGDGTYTYSYDFENRLIAAAGAGMSASYLYDPAERRYEKQVSGGNYPCTTQFLSAGDDEIADYNGSGSLLHRYIPGRAVDQPIAEVDPSGNKYYFHQDKTGSVVAMSNASGAITEGPYTYDPYGNCLVSGVVCSGTGVAYRYTGRRLDPETGLYYYRARYYAPAIGRFLQTDPIGYKSDMDLYAYVGNDLTDRTDPTGLVGSDSSFECDFYNDCSVIKPNNTYNWATSDKRNGSNGKKGKGSDKVSSHECDSDGCHDASRTDTWDTNDVGMCTPQLQRAIGGYNAGALFSLAGVGLTTAGLGVSGVGGAISIFQPEAGAPVAAAGGEISTYGVALTTFGTVTQGLNALQIGAMTGHWAPLGKMVISEAFGRGLNFISSGKTEPISDLLSAGMAKALDDSFLHCH